MWHKDDRQIFTWKRADVFVLRKEKMKQIISQAMDTVIFAGDGKEFNLRIVDSNMRYFDQRTLSAVERMDRNKLGDVLTGKDKSKKEEEITCDIYYDGYQGIFLLGKYKDFYEARKVLIHLSNFLSNTQVYIGSEPFVEGSTFIMPLDTKTSNNALYLDALKGL